MIPTVELDLLLQAHFLFYPFNGCIGTCKPDPLIVIIIHFNILLHLGYGLTLFIVVDNLIVFVEFKQLIFAILNLPSACFTWYSKYFTTASDLFYFRSL